MRLLVRQKRLISHLKSFSLIEVTVAIAILALVTGGMSGVFWRGFKEVDSSQTLTVVYNLAREKLEEKSWIIPWPPTSEARVAVSGFSGFEREVIVTSPYSMFPPILDPRLVRVRVTVWWDNGNRSQAFETIKANY